MSTTSEQKHFRKIRTAHWDRVSPKKMDDKRVGVFYQKLLIHYYRFQVPEGLRVLELGCGHGDLLAALRPSFGVGVDFSEAMIQTAVGKHPKQFFIRADAHEVAFTEMFDIIILSDLVNDLWDLQKLLENLRNSIHPGTRLIFNFYNNLWRIPLTLVKWLGWGADTLEQNWFSPNDVFNLLRLTDYEIVKHHPRILLPLPWGPLASLANRYLVNLAPFSWFALTNFVVARYRGSLETEDTDPIPSVSIVVAARNESGNIEHIFQRIPRFPNDTEIIFVEGHSTDNTYDTIESVAKRFPDIQCKLLRQPGKGKGDAVRKGFEAAKGDILIILDADLTVPPEDLPRFVGVIASGKGEFVNGVRLVYPLENQSMRFFNILGNKFFSLMFSWLLGQPIKDTLCGTKVLWKRDYQAIVKSRSYFGDFDPFGDFDLLFGAAKLNLKIVEMPIRYRARRFGETNIQRWRHGWLLLKMVVFAARRIKFI